MSDVMPVVLMVAAGIGAAVVVLPRFKLPLQAEVGIAVCVAGLILIADSLWSEHPVGFVKSALMVIGVGLIIRSRRKREHVQQPVRVYDMHKLGRGK